MRLLQNPLLRILLALISAAGTWFAFVLLNRYLGLSKPENLATVFMASIFLHELGHWIAFKRHGISSALVFLVILGGTMPLDIKKMDALGDSAKAEIALAGMFGNVFVMILSVLLYQTRVLPAADAATLINLNASLILFNMIPFSLFDGSRFVKVLFHNITPKFASILYEVTSIPVIFCMMMMLYYRGHLGLALPLILIGFHRNMKHPLQDEKPGTMDVTQRFVWSITYTNLVLLALVAYMLTPDWSRR